MRTCIIFFLLSFFFLNAFTQVGGNQVYGNNNNQYNSNPVQKKSIIATDSTLIVDTGILLNKAADYYLVSIGVHQEAPTVEECNDLLNERIDRLIESFSKTGINKKDIFIDFISQTKIYDHNIDGKTITEFLDGFEIRKNLIIKTNDYDKIEELVVRCSKEEVYDLIKVEYYNEDPQKIYDQLLEEAMAIAEKKKEKFLQYSSAKPTGKFRIVGDNFRIYNPKNMYREYKEAFETSSVNTSYSTSYVKKLVRKDRTFYYESAENTLGVDKVIDNLKPFIGIQYVLEISMLYEIE